MEYAIFLPRLHWFHDAATKQTRRTLRLWMNPDLHINKEKKS